MEPVDKTDTLIRNYIKDSPLFIECWEFEDINGEAYTICCDQDGGEWIE